MKRYVKNNHMRKIFFVFLGSFIMSCGSYFFNIPSNIAAGGVTGISQVIKHLIPYLNIGIIMYGLEIFILFLGVVFLGKEFGMYTLLGAFTYSGYITLFDYFIKLKEPILKDNIANLVIGAVLVGGGLAIVFKQNGSTGGTDVLAKILDKFIGLGISNSILIVDSIVIFLAAIVFGLEKGIYSFLSLYITTYAIDVTIAGFNTKIQMTIISEYSEIINDYIFKEINRGTTYYKAVGGYTKKDRDILVTIVDKKQYIKIRNYIDSIDEHAFVYISNINEVIGYGFSKEK